MATGLEGGRNRLLTEFIASISTSHELENGEIDVMRVVRRKRERELFQENYTHTHAHKTVRQPHINRTSTAH